MLKSDLTDTSIFSEHTVVLDSGFQGIDKIYEIKLLGLPHKKPKGKPHTYSDKVHNQFIGRIRVVVEHSIGYLKRYRILSDRFRSTNIETADQVIDICAGLANFRLKRTLTQFDLSL